MRFVGTAVAAVVEVCADEDSVCLSNYPKLRKYDKSCVNKTFKALECQPLNSNI